MKYPCKVEHLSTSWIKNVSTSRTNVLGQGKEQETLFPRFSQGGYDLLETRTINGHVGGVHTISDAAGLLVIIRKRDTH